MDIDDCFVVNEVVGFIFIDICVEFLIKFVSVRYFEIGIYFEVFSIEFVF